MQKISLWSVFTVGGFMSSCENSFSWVRNRAWIMNLNTTPYRQGWMASSKSNLQTFRDNMCFRKLRSPRTPYMFHQNDAKRLFFRDNSSYRQKLFLNRTIAWWNSDVGGSWHCVWGHLKLHSMHKHFLTSFFFWDLSMSFHEFSPDKRQKKNSIFCFPAACGKSVVSQCWTQVHPRIMFSYFWNSLYAPAAAVLSESGAKQGTENHVTVQAQVMWVTSFISLQPHENWRWLLNEQNTGISLERMPPCFLVQPVYSAMLVFSTCQVSQLHSVNHWCRLAKALGLRDTQRDSQSWRISR